MKYIKSLFTVLGNVFKTKQIKIVLLFAIVAIVFLVYTKNSPIDIKSYFNSATSVKQSPIKEPLESKPISFQDREKYDKDVVIHQGFADLLEYVMPAVVSVSAVKVIQPELSQAPVTNNPLLDSFLKNFNLGPRQATSLGSGFILNKDGVIVTNNHVIENAKEVKVVLKDERVFDAEILASDKLSDIAVLKIKAEDLPTLNLGDSSQMRVGDWIIAIGNPFGLGGSASTGIISAIDRSISIGPYNEFIQTDASINRGNSGGPMVNLKGEVVGINTAIASPTGGSVGIGFAIPSNSVKNIVLQLIESGSVKRSWLGVQIQDLDEDIASYFGLDKNVKGVVVTNVIDDSPAKKVGLKPGDIILSINGEPASSSSKVVSKIANLPPNSKVSLQVLSGENKKEITIILSERPEEENSMKDEDDSLEDYNKTLRHEFSNIGISVIELNDTLREKYNIKDEEDNLIIDKVEDSLMKNKGISSGMIVLELNKKRVKTIEDMKNILSSSDDKQVLILLKIPNGSRVYMTLNRKSK